jgi:hypothetical protein
MTNTEARSQNNAAITPHVPCQVRSFRRRGVERIAAPQHSAQKRNAERSRENPDADRVRIDTGDYDFQSGDAMWVNARSRYGWM